MVLCEDLMEIFQENGLYGLKNCGNVIIVPQYIEFYPFSCGLACVRNTNYKYGYIDHNNRTVVPFGKYIWVDPYFISGYARVKEYSYFDDKEYWGIINTLGKLVVPLEYDNIWTINEQFIHNLKAYKNGKEYRINLRKAEKYIVLNGLKYIKTFTIEEFKEVFNVSRIFVRKKTNNLVYFTYGTNIGIVSNDNFLQKPVISIVCNSAGKVFCLLHHQDNTGKLQIQKFIKSEEKSSYLSDCYDSNEEYNDYAKESTLDAFEGDESNYWNID